MNYISFYGKCTMNTPRGIRNNNPGNIRWGSDWKGLKKDGKQQDPSFCIFKTPEYGNRIMTIELENGEKINLILDQGFSYWRCLAYCYAENIFPFDADIDEQVAKIGQWLPNVSGDTYPTRIFYTKSK